MTLRGDRGAFDELAQRIRPRVVALLRQRLRDEADVQDATQRTLLRWWEKRTSYDVARPFVPWLMTIAIRLSVDTQRAGARRKTHEDAAGDASVRAAVSPPGPAKRIEQRETQEHVWALVRERCHADTAEALWLFYGEGLSASEIGAVLNKRPGAVRLLLHRGREALREPMRQQGWGLNPTTSSALNAEPAANKSSTGGTNGSPLNMVGVSS